MICIVTDIPCEEEENLYKDNSTLLDTTRSSSTLDQQMIDYLIVACVVADNLWQVFH
jgi:hypothetical protein